MPTQSGIKARFYRMAKRRNSTLLPDYDSRIAELDIVINNQNTSINNPQLKLYLNVGENVNLLGCNYIHIPAFQRYYYIDDISYNADGTWTFACSVDVLASFRSEIFACPGYVGRASNPTYENTDVADSFYPAENHYLTITETNSTGFSSNPQNGAFIIGVVSNQSPNLGAVSYFVVTPSQLDTLVQKMVGFHQTGELPKIEDIDGITGDVLKSLVNPFQFITSCKWFPFEGSFIDTADSSNPPDYNNQNIIIFGWSTGVTARKLRSGKMYVNFYGGYFDLRDVNTLNEYERHGETIDLALYPKYAPYAQYSIITPWGTFDLDASVMTNLYNYPDAEGHRRIYYDITTNLITGLGIIEIYYHYLTGYTTNSQNQLVPEYKRFILARKEINIAVDVPLAQVSIDYYAAAKAMTSAVGEAGNAIGWIANPIGTGANVANHILDATKAAMSPSVAISGSGNAGITPIIDQITFQIKRFRTIPKSPETMGRPVKRFIPNITILRDETHAYYYVQMDTAYFTSNIATSGEVDNVINYLMGGVYLE